MNAASDESSEYESAEEAEALHPSTSEAVADTQPAASDKLKRGLMNYGCEHYRRRCMLVAPCCNETFWCRHCHNTVKSDNEQDPKKRHTLDRKLVTEVECALCLTRQPTAHSCRECGVAFGQYSCLECNFFDDDLSKEQFHCDLCQICRVGGRDNYFHCSTCNCCYAITLRDSHVCIENSMHQNCPCCFEYLFDSIRAINVMPCGHTIHNECLKALASHSTYLCPVCMKSYMGSSDMERLWDEMDTTVRMTPMPEEYRDMVVDVMCNDCLHRSNVPFHVVGHKCGNCGGYNTRRV
eukprot:gene19776-26468_t